MPGNVLILMSGLTGISVLTGRAGRAGYWTDETPRKRHYDTGENSDLVALNNASFAQLISDPAATIRCHNVGRSADHQRQDGFRRRASAGRQQ